MAWNALTLDIVTVTHILNGHNVLAKNDCIFMTTAGTETINDLKTNFTTVFFNLGSADPRG